MLQVSKSNLNPSQTCAGRGGVAVHVVRRAVLFNGLGRHAADGATTPPPQQRRERPRQGTPSAKRAEGGFVHIYMHHCTTGNPGQLSELAQTPLKASAAAKGKSLRRPPPRCLRTHLVYPLHHLLMPARQQPSRSQGSLQLFVAWQRRL